MMRWLPEHGVAIVALGNLTYASWGVPVDADARGAGPHGSPQAARASALRGAPRRAGRRERADPRAVERHRRGRPRRGQPLPRHAEGEAQGGLRGAARASTAPAPRGSDRGRERAPRLVEARVRPRHDPGRDHARADARRRASSTSRRPPRCPSPRARARGRRLATPPAWGFVHARRGPARRRRDGVPWCGSTASAAASTRTSPSTGRRHGSRP